MSMVECIWDSQKRKLSISLTQELRGERGNDI